MWAAFVRPNYSNYSDQEDSMKKRLMILGLITFLMSCGGGGSSNSGPVAAADVDELNLTGVWRLVGIRCADSSLQNITAEGTVSPGSAAETVVIQGNQYTEESLASSCKVSMSRSINASLVVGDASDGYGTGTLGATSASVFPTSSCTLSIAFNMNFGNISPSTVISTYTQAQSIPQQIFEFLIKPPYIAITTLIQVVGRPTDICFLIYQKL